MRKEWEWVSWEDKDNIYLFFLLFHYDNISSFFIRDAVIVANCIVFYIHHNLVDNLHVMITATSLNYEIHNSPFISKLQPKHYANSIYNQNNNNNNKKKNKNKRKTRIKSYVICREILTLCLKLWRMKLEIFLDVFENFSKHIFLHFTLVRDIRNCASKKNRK